MFGKKIILVLLLFILFSCESTEDNRRCNIINNQTINLANPQFINLQVPGGWAYANGGARGLVIYNFGNNFKAFSRECPADRTCTEPMTMLNDIKLVCSCDDSEYSILDGSPQTPGFNQSVCEFRVYKASGSILNITNF
ncbi:MAG: hypothetical protein KAH07_07405 [Flavobacteriaceae bacterium]|nr:hypothetical protein [Flavobacteriaceae bacterium]